MQEKLRKIFLLAENYISMVEKYFSSHLRKHPFIIFSFHLRKKYLVNQQCCWLKACYPGTSCSLHYKFEFLAKSQIWKFKHESTFLLACLTRLTAKQKFSYTLSFLLVPLPFFVYEFFTSRQLGTLAQKGRDIVNQMAKCQSIMEFIVAYCW